MQTDGNTSLVRGRGNLAVKSFEWLDKDVRQKLISEVARMRMLGCWLCCSVVRSRCGDEREGERERQLRLSHAFAMDDLSREIQWGNVTCFSPFSGSESDIAFVCKLFRFVHAAFWRDISVCCPGSAPGLMKIWRK